VALLNRTRLNALASVEEKELRSFRSIASGFLVGFLSHTSKIPEKRRYRIFLVTNRHVFEGKDEVFLRFNKRGGGTTRFAVNLVVSGQPIWLAHRSKKVDLAMLTVNPKTLDRHNVDWVFFNEEMFAYQRSFQKIGIELGDAVFVLGFPLGLSGRLQNFPIVRQGVISRCDKEILSSEKAFIVDASIFPGNSGGPVLLKPELSSLGGTQAVNTAYLLGVVAGYLPYKEILYSHQTTLPSYAGVSVENSDLGYVVPMDYVRQIYRNWVKTKKKLAAAHKGTEKSAAEPLMLKCKSCGKPFNSGIVMDRKSYETATLRNNRHRCSQCGVVESYDKEDYFFEG